MREGDLWTIRGKANATALIGRIDGEGDDAVAHLCVVLETPPHLVERLGPKIELGHMPLFLRALANALETRIDENQTPPPAFLEGHASWSTDPDAGIFDMPLLNAINAIVTIAFDGPR